MQAAVSCRVDVPNTFFVLRSALKVCDEPEPTARRGGKSCAGSGKGQERRARVPLALSRVLPKGAGSQAATSRRECAYADVYAFGLTRRISIEVGA